MSDHRTLIRNPRIQLERSRTTRTKSQLSAATKKQLLQDIEDSGGLHVFSLQQLRAKRPDFYDSSKETLRQVQNLIQVLKKLDDSEYLLKLSSYSVVATSRVSNLFSPTTEEACLSSPTPRVPSVPPPETPHTTSSIANEQVTTESAFLTPPRRTNYTSTRMSSSSGQHNALALRPIPTHHDEDKGML